jgi:hypothetical protein
MMRQPLIKLLLLMLSICFAQGLLPASRASAQTSKPLEIVTKFDEFEQLHGCDFGARLDNFAIMLMAQPGVEGYVVSYGPEGKGSGTGDFNLKMIENYLVNMRGLEKERFKTVYGGRYKNLTGLATELWLVPQGAEPPELRKYKNTSKKFTGKFEEFEAPDSMAEGEGEGIGPYSGNAMMANFADILQQQPETRAYIVAYSARDATTGAWRRVTRDLAADLESEYGIEANRIKMIFAGYDKKLGETDPQVKVQLWILPNDAPPPVREAKAERRPKEAVQIGTFDKYWLSYAANAKRVFDGFADVLRADEQLRACIIVRPSIELPDPEAGIESLPNIDLMQLVEKWKTELAKSYKIDEGRLLIIAASARDESSGGTLDTWIVPPGAALPDPYPPQEDAGGEEEEEAVEGENPQGF